MFTWYFMKKDRFLFAILGFIGLIVIVALVLFFLRQDADKYGSDDTPEGVVRNYVIALYENDFERAYGYLQETDTKPDYFEFQKTFLGGRLEISNVSVKISKVEIFGDEAIVQLIVTHGGTDPFQGTRNNNESALLTLQEGGWKITEMPHPYWGWDW